MSKEDYARPNFVIKKLSDLKKIIRLLKKCFQIKFEIPIKIKERENGDVFIKLRKIFFQNGT